MKLLVAFPSDSTNSHLSQMQLTLKWFQICAECHGIELRTSASSAGAIFRSQPHDWLSLPFL